MIEHLIELTKYLLPAIVVLVATVMIVNNFLIKETERKRLAIFEKNSDTAMRLRLQAYERLAILVERMHPRSLVGRFYYKEATAQDLQIEMVNAIRSEFEHNLSQQLYVSHEVWQTIRSVMEQEIMMINRVGASCELGTPASEFVKRLTDFVLTSESAMPTDIALEIINKEAKATLFPPTT